MYQKLLFGLTGLVAALALAGCDAFKDADARVARANELIAAHDYRGAMIELKNAAQKEPNHVAARLKLVEVALQLGDSPEAESNLRHAIESGAQPAATAELAARIRLALGQFRELLAQMDAGELVLPEPGRSLYRAQAFYGLRQHEAALAAFQAALQADPGSIIARAGIAEVHAAQGNSDQALVELGELLKDQPAAALAWLVRGTIHARRGEFESAEQDLREAQQRADTTLTATKKTNLLALLVEVQIARGEAAAADTTHVQLMKLAPAALVTRVLAGRIAMSKQDYATAVAELQRCVTAAPDFVAARFLLGAALLAQGSLQQAEVQLSQVLQVAPENVEARKLLAQTRLRLGRPDSAMQVLLPVQPSDGEDESDPQMDMLLGLAYLQQGNRSIGVEHLERAVAARPDMKNLQLDLAAAYIGSGRADKAVELLTKMVPGSDDIRQSSLLIAALASFNDRQAAQQEVERLLREHPRDPTVLILAANYFGRERQFDRAREVLERASDVSAKDVSSILARARIEAAAGDLDAASLWLKKALAVDADSAAARRALSEISLRRGDLSAAAAGLEELRKRDAAAVEPRLRLVALYRQMKNTKAADAIVKELDALAENRPEVVNAIGQLNLQAGRYDEALLRFRSAATLDSANPTYWFNVARVQIVLGNTPAAREALEKSLAARPDWIPAVGALAMLDVKDKDTAAAVSRIAQVKKDHSDDPQVLTLEGDVMMALQDFGKASVAYDAAAVLKPSGITAIKAYRARQQGKIPEPTRPLESWLVREPADSSARMLLAEAYQRAGDTRRAIAQYETIQSAGTATGVVLNNLAWLYHEVGDARAEQTAKRAYDSAPGLPAVADTYGWILVQSAKPQDAVELLKRAAATAKDPTIQYHYAAALAGAGSKAESRRVLTELLGQGLKFDAATDARKLLDSLPEG